MLLAQALEQGVSTVLVDLGSAEGRSAVPLLARSLPDPCIIGFSIDETADHDVVDCVRLGCHGIVPLNATLKDVVRIARAAERGEAEVHPKVAASLMRALSIQEAPSQAAPSAETIAALTLRERQVCALICEGMTNKEIALEVNRSVSTIKNHVHSILTKFNLQRRAAIHRHVHDIESVRIIR